MEAENGRISQVHAGPTQIYLHGYLKEAFFERTQMYLRTPADAVKGLCINLDGFEEVLREGYYELLVNGRAIGLSELQIPVRSIQRLDFIPILGGAGGNVGKILLGGLLIAAAFVMPSGISFLGTTLSNVVGGVGIMLAVSGLSGLIFPKQQNHLGIQEEDPESRGSFSFNGPIQTTSEGRSVPIGYGEVLVGSHQVSVGIDVVDLTGYAKWSETLKPYQLSTDSYDSALRKMHRNTVLPERDRFIAICKELLPGVRAKRFDFNRLTTALREIKIIGSKLEQAAVDYAKLYPKASQPKYTHTIHTYWVYSATAIVRVEQLVRSIGHFLANRSSHTQWDDSNPQWWNLPWVLKNSYQHMELATQWSDIVFYRLGTGDTSFAGALPQKIIGRDNEYLESKQTIQIVDLISEGEVQGLVDDKKSIYLDDQPIVSATNTSTTGFEYQFLTGDPAQNGFSRNFESIPLEQERGVDKVLRYKQPVEVRIDNPNVSEVRIKIAIPKLFLVDRSTGNYIKKQTVFELSYRYADRDDYQFVNQYSFNSRVTSRYERAISLNIDSGIRSHFPIYIKLERNRRDLTDSERTTAADEVYFTSYTQIIRTKLAFTNSAVIAMKLDSETRGKIPKRGYWMKLLKVKIPSNYQGDSRSYTDENWDGQFNPRKAYTNNPAWCFYDLLSNPRYGMGEWLGEPNDVDYWDLYRIARYCDEKVPDGEGGLEHRFSLNCYIQNQSQAFELVKQLASVFRGMLFWNGSMLSIVQDTPKPPSHRFTQANVINGEFRYAGTSKRARHTVALVSWNNPKNLFKKEVEYVEYPEGIRKYGVQRKEIEAFGCTSRGQAKRLGQWILYSENFETETLHFRVGLSSILLAPGDIIEVQDKNKKQGLRWGGRVLSSTENMITLDQKIALKKNQSYRVGLMHPDGRTEERQVQQKWGLYKTLPLANSIAGGTIEPGTVWILSSSEERARLYRVLSISEVEKNIFEVSAVEQNPNKYTWIDQGQLPSLDNSNSNSLTPIEIELRGVEYVSVKEQGDSLLLHWPRRSSAKYVLRFKNPGQTEWSAEMVLTSPSYVHKKTVSGTYEFSLWVQDRFGKRSQGHEMSFTSE